MRGRASLWCQIGVAVSAGSFAFLPRAATGSESGPTLPVLSIEDLQDALDRGDLTPSEFDLLSELVLERQLADSALALRLAPETFRLPSGTAGTRTRGRRSRLHYSVRAPIRGTGTRGDELRLLPSFEAFELRVIARRNASGRWAVTDAASKVHLGRLTMEVGALHVLWAGGLLAGRAPALVGEGARGLPGLWQPSRARLRGGLVRVTSAIEAEAFGSHISDSTWSHGASGLRCRLPVRSGWIEPAVVAQRVTRVSSGTHFAPVVWGLSLGARSRVASFRAHAAYLNAASAIHGVAEGKSAARWRLEYWAVAPGFRNPLAHAAGEFDRENVFYPELDTSLASASTGESGGRIALRTGASRSFGEARATLWRERPSRPAAVRFETAVQRTSGGGVARLDYSYSQRPGTFGHSRRHQTTLRYRRGWAVGELGGRWTQSALTHRPLVGGRAACGLRVHSAGTGQWEAGMACDVNDLSLASGRFVTLRVHHSLPLGRAELSWHLRWRSRYANHPAALSLRIDSSLGL